MRTFAPANVKLTPMIACFSLCEELLIIITIHIINLEEKPELVHVRSISKECETVQEFFNAYVAAVVSVKQLKESLRKKGLQINVQP